MFGWKAVLCFALGSSASSFVVNGQTTYDAVVIGSGPGGLAAAEYLSRNSSVSVLIIEAGSKSLEATGGTVTPSYAEGLGLTTFDIPGQYESNNYNSSFSDYRIDWIADGGSMWLGKLVGGCSSINAALYFHPPDNYVTGMDWPFSPESMTAKFTENEMTYGVTDKPSTDGMWYTQEGYDIVSKALLAQGFTETTINNPESRNNMNWTFGHAPFTFKDGRRDSPANSFWGKMKTRSNVELLTDTKVDHILHSSGVATGVVYGETTVQLSSRGVVVMAAGALNTPKVLIQSGIGPSEQISLLQKNGNFPAVFQDNISNPYVGRNLFDTNAVFTSFSHPDMKSLNYRSPPSWATEQYVNQNHSGPMSSSGPVLIAFENFEVQGRQCDFQSTVLTHGYGSFASQDDALMISVYLNNPESRAASGFNANGDWYAFNEGEAYAGTSRDLAALQQYTQRVVSRMTAQGSTFLSAASDANGVAAWVASNAKNVIHHYGGSCYASTNSSEGSKRCADEKMRVLGTRNIFVADASAMRDGTVNPYGFTMYIGRETGEQAAAYVSAGGAGDEWTIEAPQQPATCSTVEVDVDYPGNDLSTFLSSTAGGCCPVCQTTTNCKFFTWTSYNGGTCWLKSAKGTPSTVQGALSAQFLY